MHLSQARSIRKRFVIAGGRSLREYRDAGKAVIQNTDDDLMAWNSRYKLGHLLRTIFKISRTTA
jgi:hypothetical protein